MAIFYVASLVITREYINYWLAMRGDRVPPEPVEPSANICQESSRSGPPDRWRVRNTSEAAPFRSCWERLVVTCFIEKSSTGWWLSPTPLKNMKVSWDDDIPNTVYGKIKFMFQTTNQSIARPCSMPFSMTIVSLLAGAREILQLFPHPKMVISDRLRGALFTGLLKRV